MGNSSSSSSASTTAPTTEQVDTVVAALETAWKDVTKDMSNVDPELLVLQVRAKLQQLSPSAMGCPMIAPDISDCIGQTKLVRVNKIGRLPDENNNTETPSFYGEVVAKVEFTNPGLSVKDRIAQSMILDAEQKGTLKPGMTVVDVTSGNTGIALAMVAAARGYPCIQIIPEPYSVERRAMMMALGAQVVVTPKEAGIPGTLKKYVQILNELGVKAWAPRQFDNPANLMAHTEHTGPEIWEQCQGKVDVLVAAYGTGGTLSGCAQYLRSKNPNLMVVCVEPMEQSLLNGDPPGPHGIQGIVPPFVPDNVKVEVIDEVVRCPTASAMKTARDLGIHGTFVTKYDCIASIVSS